MKLVVVEVVVMAVVPRPLLLQYRLKGVAVIRHLLIIMADDGGSSGNNRSSHTSSRDEEEELQYHPSPKQKTQLD